MFVIWSLDKLMYLISSLMVVLAHKSDSPEAKSSFPFLDWTFWNFGLGFWTLNWELASCLTILLLFFSLPSTPISHLSLNLTMTTNIICWIHLYINTVERVDCPSLSVKSSKKLFAVFIVFAQIVRRIKPAIECKWIPWTQKQRHFHLNYFF